MSFCRKDMSSAISASMSNCVIPSAFQTRYTNRRMVKETYAKLTAMIEATGNAERSSFAAYALGLQHLNLVAERSTNRCH